MLAVAFAGCGASRYPLNLAARSDMALRTQTAALEADLDVPPRGENETAWMDQLALLDLAGAAVPAIPEALRATWAARQKSLRGRLRAQQALATGWRLPAHDREVFHEVSAAVLDVPFAEVSLRLSPAQNWGCQLENYLGGEIAIDATDTDQRPVLVRERMVLGTPWYALGARDLDLSKYELISYASDSIRVSWTVTHSANDSVYRDDGYLLFRPWDGGERTLAIFNSVHHINAGWFASVLPSAWARALTLDSIVDAFRAHLRRYQTDWVKEPSCRPR